MTHTIRTALAVAAVLGLSQFAHAGPLHWGYRAESPNGGVLRAVSGLTDLTWADNFLPDPERYGTPVPDPDANEYYQSDIWRSAAKVTIIDERSGQAGSFPLYVEFVRQYQILANGTRELIYEGLRSNAWPEPTVFTLGGSTYSVRAPGGEFMVEVTPAVTTPEPGALALAGCGLAAVFARRLRRPRISRGAAAAVLVCLGLFGGSGSASAGPIEWDYLADIRPDGSGRIQLGTVPGPNGTVEVVAALRGEDLEAPGSGSQRIRISSLLDIDVTTAEASGAVAQARWFSDLTITDRASGVSGQVSITGRGTYIGDDQLLDPKVMLELLDGDAAGRRELVLGGNKYSIQYLITQGDNDRISTLWADITVSPVATPEPSTLALAGFGLSAVFARRLGRS